MRWLICGSLERVCVRTFLFVFFFQAEDGIRDLVRSRGLGDVYKRQDRGLGRLVHHGANLQPRPVLRAGQHPIRRVQR